MQEGLVIRTTGSWYRVLLADSSQYDCRLRGNYRL
ncbi:MAG: ribosome small subunit-dependent GTPase A, partial [Bacteroidales bacterium]|nr:ribosome small subunit-dependent GTPase A [Bacteroidales bacterium]